MRRMDDMENLIYYQMHDIMDGTHELSNELGIDDQLIRELLQVYIMSLGDNPGKEMSKFLWTNEDELTEDDIEDIVYTVEKRFDEASSLLDLTLGG